MPRTGDVDDIQIPFTDHAVEMHIHEVQSWRRPPVAEKSWLDVLERERLTKERVRQQIDLADREVVRGAPICIDMLQRVVGERARNRPLRLRGNGRGHSAL